MKNLSLVASLLLCGLSACSSVKEAMHGERMQPAAVRLTLIPLAAVATNKPTEINAKITHNTNLSLITSSEMPPKQSNDLTLYALDTSFSDLKTITAKATSTDGLYQFTFTPSKNTSYRIWANAPLIAQPLAALPFSDIGARSNVQFNKEEILTQKLEDSTITLKSDSALKLFNETTLSLESSNGSTVSIIDMIAVYNDYRTLVHLAPHDGKVTFSPDKEGLLKCFIRINTNGKETTLPFTIAITKD